MNTMKTLVLASIILLSGVSNSCDKEKETPGEVKPVQLTEKQRMVVNRSNTFGFDFFRKVYEKSGNEKNLMVSPLSVSMAFGMARNGAAEGTLEAINQTLGMGGLSDSEINESYKYILETFSELDPRVKMAIANSIWYRNTFHVEQDFISTNQQYFHAEVNPLDFTSPSAVEQINDWVSTNTNDLIPTIIEEIPEAMVMYLINAVYFKGQWRYQFDKKNTMDKPFHLEGGSTIQAPFMVQKTDLSFYDGDGFRAAELPYNQGNYNMVVMLPDEGKTVSDIIAKLTTENWKNWQKSFTTGEIQLQLPKFKFAYEEKNMKPILSDMGMTVAFIPDVADFTRINKAGQLFISEVKHKTFIETNEEGTEAAAVTSIGIEVTSVGPNPVELILDRPFVFFIHEKTSGSILFIGTIMNPGQE